MATLNFGQDLKGAWLVGIMLILYVVGGMGGLYLSDLSFFRSPQGPGVDPPFYFIRRDFILGFSYGLTGLPSVALAIYYRKRYPPYAWMAIWMTVLWSGGHFAKSIVIAFKTTHLFTPAQSTSSWLTFSDYMYDPLIICAQFGMLFLAPAIALLTRNKIKPFLKAETLHPSTRAFSKNVLSLIKYLIENSGIREDASKLHLQDQESVI